MSFVPFRNITNRGALVSLLACVVLSAAYVKLDQAVEKRDVKRRGDGVDGWPMPTPASRTSGSEGGPTSVSGGAQKW